MNKNMLKTKYMDNQVQIIFKTSPDLKEYVLAKTKREGITLKALFTMAIKAYINNDFVVGLHKNEEPSEFLINAIKEADVDLKEGNINKFKNSKEMINHLDGLK